MELERCFVIDSLCGTRVKVTELTELLSEGCKVEAATRADKVQSTQREEKSKQSLIISLLIYTFRNTA